MTAPQQRLAAVERTYTNYALILLMLTEAMPTGQAPNQQNIEAIINQAGILGVVTPKPTTSIDGESYDWAGYQLMLTEQMSRLERLRQILSGPFEIRSQAGTW